MLVKLVSKVQTIANILKLKILYGKKIKIGKNVNFRGKMKVRIDKGAQIIINNGCFFNDGCSLNAKELIEIGENTIFGENVKIYDHNHVFNLEDKNIKDSGYKVEKIYIGDNCWICSDVTILKGVTVGSNTVIGTKELVNKNVGKCSILSNGKEEKIRFNK